MSRLTDLVYLVLFVAEIVGTVAFAASGAMLAIDRDLDLFGVMVLGIITAVGGGITRDICLGIFPPNAFTSSVYVLIAFVTSVGVFLFAYLKGRRYWRSREGIDRVINLLDAIGLGVFSVVGVQTAVERGFADNAFLCITMGLMTGVGGGMLRDVLSQTVPAVLKKRIYAVASIAGSASFYILMQYGADTTAAMLCGMGITVLIRLLATRFAWDLPKVRRI